MVRSVHWCIVGQRLNEATSGAEEDGAPRARAGSSVAPGDELVLARSGRWRLLIPMSYVERIHGAALPAVVPAAGSPAHALVSIGGNMVPILFCEALLGADSVTLAGSDLMILLHDQGRRALLWVSAAEEVVPFEPLATDAEPPELALGFSGRERAHAVLDVPKLLDLAFKACNADPGRGVPT